MLEMASGAVPPLDSVMAFGTLAVPTASLPKSRLVADGIAVGATPVPVRGMTSVPSIASSATVRVPVRGPVRAGSKSTDTVHVAFTKIGLLEVQVSVAISNSAVVLTETMLSGTELILVTVIVCGALGLPTG